MSRDLPPQSSIAGTAAAAESATVCTNCFSDDRFMLHYVRLRGGTFHKLCTSCVLKLHPTSFCPTCFSLHDPTTTPSIPKTLTCFKCSSLSHSTCVPPNAPRSPYLCFLCSNPSFKLFDVRKPDKNVPEGDKKVPVIDDRMARMLLSAATISSITMNKAKAAAKAETEKKVREAALARKRAKEAIDYVTALSARNAAAADDGGCGGNKRREAEVPTPPVVSGLKGPAFGPVKLEKNGGIGIGMGNNLGAGNPPEVKNVDGSNSSNGSSPVPTTTVVAPHLQGNNNNGSVDHVGGGPGGGPGGLGKDGTLSQVK